MDAKTTAREVGAAYAPLDPAHTADPYPFYARARREAPVFYSPAIDAWVVSSYGTVAAVLKDHRRFATAPTQGRSHTPGVLAILASTPIIEKVMLSVDPPEHTRLRGSINRALSARRVAALEPRIRGLCDGLIDRFEARGGADFVERFAHPFPVLVIGSLLDLPEADFANLGRWADDLVTLFAADLSPEAQIACAQSILALDRYVYDLAERRHREPGSDLASELIMAVDSGEAPLSAVEVAAMLQVLIVAGFETTIRLLGTCLHHLLAERRHWQAIVDDPARIPSVVEEALRFEGPLIGTMRRAREDVELGGCTIPSGALVRVLLASANHDEAAFPDAETFDPGRVEPAGHLSFGQGVHFCIGALLARLEARVALEQLTRRMPSLRLAPGRPVTYRPSLVVRGVDELHVEWDERR